MHLPQLNEPPVVDASTELRTTLPATVGRPPSPSTRRRVLDSLFHRAPAPDRPHSARRHLRVPGHSPGRTSSSSRLQAASKPRSSPRILPRPSSTVRPTLQRPVMASAVVLWNAASRRLFSYDTLCAAAISRSVALPDAPMATTSAQPPPLTWTL